MLDVEALPNPTELDLGRLLPLLSRRGIRAVALRHPDNALAAVASRYGLAFANSAAQPRSAQAAAEPAPKPPSNRQRPCFRADHDHRPAGARRPADLRQGRGLGGAGDGQRWRRSHRGRQHTRLCTFARSRLAGARGNHAARIFARSMEAELVSIAGVYRTIEQALPDSILGKPTQIYLENERLVMTALGE
ncbi:septum formation inhibitor [Chromobacterium violaceum]|uniref:Septum formation inhibitor n=1 Tax=Chromobacterium violaceum TaxID=536 RepID=A0A3S5DLS8_CHRVL|nr:septum formation inhibitor [Chromobacterium violaceum]